MGYEPPTTMTLVLPVDAQLDWDAAQRLLQKTPPDHERWEVYRDLTDTPHLDATKDLQALRATFRGETVEDQPWYDLISVARYGDVRVYSCVLDFDGMGWEADFAFTISNLAHLGVIDALGVIEPVREDLHGNPLPTPGAD